MNTRKIQLLDTSTKPGGLAWVPADFRARRVDIAFERTRVARKRARQLTICRYAGSDFLAELTKRSGGYR
jgi:hypothetical protein